MVPGYRVPSNFELIQQADLVVLARVKAGPGAEDIRAANSWDEQQIELEPIRAIKGVLPSEVLRLEGYTGERGHSFAAHPTPLHRAHPSSFQGACVRQEYAPGALLVATFERTDKGYRPLRSAFARVAEDVEGENGAWVRAADAYARIGALPTGDARRTALRAEAARLLALRDDSAAPAIAADMLDAAGELPD